MKVFLCKICGHLVFNELSTPGVHPAACFHLKEAKGKVTITEHCNLHGYWKTDCDL